MATIHLHQTTTATPEQFLAGLTDLTRCSPIPDDRRPGARARRRVAARMYWENGRSIAAALAAGQKSPELSLPVAFTVFPGEIFQAPRSWAERVYPNLIYFHEAERGGHFAAWEEPQLFAEELRAAFRSLR